MTSPRTALAQALAVLAPHIPAFDRACVLDRAQDSPGLRKASPQAAAWLALTSHVRHRYTEYQALLEQGYDRISARHFCAKDMEHVLTDWGCRPKMIETLMTEPAPRALIQRTDGSSA